MMALYVVCMCTQVAYSTGVPVDMGLILKPVDGAAGV